MNADCKLTAMAARTPDADLKTDNTIPNICDTQNIGIKLEIVTI